MTPAWLRRLVERLCATRGAPRTSAAFRRWLPGGATGWAALVLTLAVPVALLVALRTSKSTRAEASGCSSHSVQRALADDSFSPVTRVADLPPAVLETFWRAYGQTGEDRRIADPGEPFQSTDLASKQRLPWRRLLFGGRSRRVAYLYYEKGGRASTRHLFVTCLDSPKPRAFSYAAPPPVDSPGGLGGALKENCLVSPPREQFGLAEREACF